MTNPGFIDFDTLPDSALVTDTQAASYLTVEPGTLAVWRCTGRHNLKFVKVGRRVRYRVGDLRAWVERRTRTHSDGAA